MKQILLLLSLIFSLSLNAQETELTNSTSRFNKAMQGLTVTASVGTGYYQDHSRQLGSLSLGELSIQYKTNAQLSFGLGTIGALLCDETYLDDEGNPVEDDDDNDGPEDPDDDMDEDGEEDCDDFDFGENVMGLATWQFSSQIPFFLRAGAGYSFNTKAPAYTVMLGYNQKLFGGLGLTGGIRYSDIVKTAKTRNFIAPIGGLKAELGLSWNF